MYKSDRRLSRRGRALRPVLGSRRQCRGSARPSGQHHPAAAGNERLAGHEAGSYGKQEQDDFGRLTDPPKRSRPDDTVKCHPIDGDTFTILTANPISGAFASVNGLDYDNVVERGRVVQLDQTLSDITLRAFQAAYGYANMDREVNSGDLFAILAAAKFNAGPSNATWLEGDFNNDDEVNSADLCLILSTGKYNQGPYSATAPMALATVPEPSAFVLAALGLAGLVASASRLKPSPPAWRV